MEADNHGSSHSITSNTLELPSSQRTILEFLYWLGDQTRHTPWISSAIACLVLGGFGSFMSGWSFWICLATMSLHPFMELSVRPTWTWVISYLRDRSSSQSDLNISDDDRARGETSTAIIRVVLAIVLLVIRRETRLSKECSTPLCSDRGKDSLLGLALVVLVLEGIPLFLMCAAQITRSVRVTSIERAKRSCRLLQRAHDEFITDGSLTWDQAVMIVQSFNASASSAVLLSIGGLLLGGNYSNFMTRGCWRVCFGVVVVELLAQNAGPLKAVAGNPSLATCIGAEKRPRQQYEEEEEEGEELLLDRLIVEKGFKQSNKQLKEVAIARLWLRVPLHFIIFFVLYIYLLDGTYFPLDLADSSCDAVCKANGKALLVILWIFSFSQYMTAMPVWAPFQILAAFIPGFPVLTVFLISVVSSAAAALLSPLVLLVFVFCFVYLYPLASLDVPFTRPPFRKFSAAHMKFLFKQVYVSGLCLLLLGIFLYPLIISEDPSQVYPSPT